jgi:hypothetical protein
MKGENMAIKMFPKKHKEPPSHTIWLDAAEKHMAKALKKANWSIELVEIRRGTYYGSFRIYKVTSAATELYLQLICIGMPLPQSPLNICRNTKLALYNTYEEIPLRKDEPHKKYQAFKTKATAGHQYLGYSHVDNVVEAIEARLDKDLHNQIENVVIQNLKDTPGLSVVRKSNNQYYSISLDVGDMFITDFRLAFHDGKVKLEAGWRDRAGGIQTSIGSPTVGKDIHSQLLAYFMNKWNNEIKERQELIRRAKHSCKE